MKPLWLLLIVLGLVLYVALAGGRPVVLGRVEPVLVGALGGFLLALLLLEFSPKRHGW
jgi:hypothetical protein